MLVGVLQLELLIHDATSLKDKRRVVRSLKDRLHREHLVAVAEVAQREAWGVAQLGVACVGDDARRIGRTLDKCVEKIRGRTDCELGAQRRTISRLELDLPQERVEHERISGEMLSRAMEDPELER